MLWPIPITFVMFMAAFFYHSIILLAHKNKPKQLFLIYCLSTFFSICGAKGLLWDGAIYVFNSFYYPKATLLYGLGFIFWLSTITLAHIELIKYYQTFDPKLGKDVWIDLELLSSRFFITPTMLIEAIPLMTHEESARDNAMRILKKFLDDS